MALTAKQEDYKEMAARVFPYVDAGQRGITPPAPLEGKEADCQRWYEMGANWSKYHKTFKNAEAA